MDRHLAMETFVRVIDTGSFSSAARQMQIGQPAVSKGVAQLEEWLGVRLLLRSTRSLTPTEGGQNFYVRAKRALEEAGGGRVGGSAGPAPGATCGKLRGQRHRPASAGSTSYLSCRGFWRNTPSSR